MKKIEFTVLTGNEFGLANIKRKAQLGFSMEDTFRNCLKSLPKRISKGWHSIEFEFEGRTVDVSKHHLIETDWDFQQSFTLS